MKKFIDILAIILPALIIALGITRVFVKKTKGFNGLVLFFAFLLLIIGLLRFFVFADRPAQPDTKLAPVTVSAHSESFNRSLENMLDHYYNMTVSFAKANAPDITHSGQQLKTALDSFKLDELKKDTLIYQTALQPYENARTELVSILADPSIDEKRGSLNVFSNELFSLLSTVRYDRAKLYWQECVNAFGEDKPGNWISKTEQSENPYGQPGCAEIKTTINFMPADTTKTP
jgi:hypothetical protein